MSIDLFIDFGASKTFVVMECPKHTKHLYHTLMPHWTLMAFLLFKIYSPGVLTSSGTESIPTFSSQTNVQNMSL